LLKAECAGHDQYAMVTSISPQPSVSIYVLLLTDCMKGELPEGTVPASDLSSARLWSSSWQANFAPADCCRGKDQLPGAQYCC